MTPLKAVGNHYNIIVKNNISSPVVIKII